MKAVRGFAVTGVLVMNLAIFWVPAFATPDTEPDLTSQEWLFFVLFFLRSVFACV